MADIIDKANDVVIQCTADAEVRVRQKAAPEHHPDFDGKHCVECGDEIESERLRMGKVRDVGCQEDYERRTARRSA